MIYPGFAVIPNRRRDRPGPGSANLTAHALNAGQQIQPVLRLPALEPFGHLGQVQYIGGDFDEPRIQKVYQLSLDDDPAKIPTEDFVRNGRLYYLLAGALP